MRAEERAKNADKKSVESQDRLDDFEKDQEAELMMKD